MWTKRENATLKDLWTRKMPPREIADKMKKTRNAVLGKIFRLKKKDGYVPKMNYESRDKIYFYKPTGKTRPCNLCREDFDMRSRFDRFCPRCSKRAGTFMLTLVPLSYRNGLRLSTTRRKDFICLMLCDLENIQKLLI